MPFILAVGGREAEAGTVALRRLGSDKQEIIQLDEVMSILADESLPPDQRRSKA